MTESDVADSSLPHEKATTLRALHVAGEPLVLPNAWDAASARMVETAGFPVVATSSVATAEVLGYDDGEFRAGRRGTGRCCGDRPFGEPSGDGRLRAWLRARAGG